MTMSASSTPSTWLLVPEALLARSASLPLPWPSEEMDPSPMPSPLPPPPSPTPDRLRPPAPKASPSATGAHGGSVFHSSKACSTSLRISSIRRRARSATSCWFCSQFSVKSLAALRAATSGSPAMGVLTLAGGTAHAKVALTGAGAENAAGDAVSADTGPGALGAGSEARLQLAASTRLAVDAAAVSLVRAFMGEPLPPGSDRAAQGEVPAARYLPDRG